MVVGQSNSSTFKFDFSGINWSNDDPVSIVNAYREALKRQEQQKKRRLLESQIVTNANRELGSVESSATISPTIPSASGSIRDQDYTSNRGIDVKNGNINRNDEIILPSIIGSQVSEQSRKRSAIESPEERRRDVKSSLYVLWNSRNVPRRLSQNNRRNVRKHAPPSYFAQFRRPGDKAAAVTSVTSAGEIDQNNSSQASTGSVTLPGRTSDSSSLFSQSTVGLSEILEQSLRPLYVDSITQTDTALDEAVNDRKRRLEVSDVTPDRKKRPGFFSADFEDSDDELKEIEVEEPFLKKRRLFANDGVTLASSPAFYRSTFELDGPGLHISPRKSGTDESNIARRRLELEREEREQQQREKEERLERERQEKEVEFERQRKELEEERKRQQLKQKELEEKERQLRKELLKKEQQLAESSTSTPSLTPFGDSGAKAGFTMGGTIATPPTTQAISSDKPSFAFGLSTTTSNDKTTTSAHSLPGFSFSSGSGATDTAGYAATKTNGDTKEDPSTLSSTPAPKFQFGAKSSMATTGLPFQFGSSSTTPSSSATAVRPIVVGTQAASSAPSTGFSFGATSGPSSTSTLSLSTKRSGSAEVPSTSLSGIGKTSAVEFSFGKASTVSSAPMISTPSSGSSLPGFALTSNASTTVASTPSHGHPLSSATTTEAIAAPSFSFGSSAAPPAVPGLTSSAPGASSLSTSETSAQSFNFGAGSTSAPNPPAVFGFNVATTATPTFGSTTASSTPAPPSTPSFNFAPSTANPASIFGFGSAQGTATPAHMTSNGMTSSTPNMFASPAPSGTPPPGRKLAPMRGRLRRR
ncbi:hypothetical protein V1506DRAFT_503024 [Lipomyces tetrasporus]